MRLDLPAIAAWTANQQRVIAAYRLDRRLEETTAAERNRAKCATYYATRRAKK